MFFFLSRNPAQQVEETAPKSEGETEGGVATEAGDAATAPPTTAAPDAAATIPSAAPQTDDSANKVQDAVKDDKADSVLGDDAEKSSESAW